MPQFGQLIQNKQGLYKKLILDLKNYINPISSKKEIFSRENIQQMTTKEYSEQEEKILMQMNSIGIPTNQDVELSQEQDYDNDPTAQWVWILDDTKKVTVIFAWIWTEKLSITKLTPLKSLYMITVAVN